MPRRKKISPSRKPPLTFIESPVSIQHGSRSPVFASDNPCTANVVPIGPNTTTTWVDPQFRNVPTSGRVTRASRRRRLTGASETTRSTSKTPPLKAKKSKLVPLKFEGDETNKTPSPVDEITYENSEEEGTISATDFKGNLQSDKAGVSTTGTSKEIRGPRIELTDKIHGIEATAAHKRLQEHQQLECTSEEELPACFTKIKRTRKKRVPKRGLNLDSDGDITLPPENPSKETEEKSFDDLTQKRPLSGDKKKRPTKRLFGQRSFDQPPDSVSDPFDTTIEGVSGGNQLQNCPRNVDTPELLSVARHFVPPLSGQRRSNPSGPLQDSTNHERFSSPIKTRRKSMQEQKLLTTPVMCKKRGKVLAYDTPEEEYGLSVRERRLRYRRK